MYYLLYGPFGRSPRTDPREHWGPFATRAEAQRKLTSELAAVEKLGFEPERKQYLIRRLTPEQYYKLFPWERNA